MQAAITGFRRLPILELPSIGGYAMGRILLAGMALAIGVLMSATPATADAFADLDACSASARNAAWSEVQYYCGAAIESGQLDDASLATALSFRCIANNQRKQHDQAIDDCTGALRINPQDQAAYNNLGAAYAQKGDPDRAIAAYDASLALDPSLTDAYLNRGLAYADKGEYDRAIADYDRALGINPFDAALYHNRGNAYVGKGEYARARDDFDQAIFYDPDRWEYYANRAVTFFKTGDTQRALEDCDTALRLDANAADAYFIRGDIRFLSGDYDHAIQDYDQGLLIDPTPTRVYEYRGHAHFVRGNFAAASGDFAVVVERTPTDGRAVLLRSIAGARAGDNVVQTFETDAARVDLTTWPGPIVKYYLGDLDKDALRQAAVTADQESGGDHMCDYGLYVGLGAIIFNDLETARTLLQQAELDCPTGSFAYVAAKAEAGRM